MFNILNLLLELYDLIAQQYMQNGIFSHNANGIEKTDAYRTKCEYR